MSLHAETPLVCFSPRLWLRAVTHEPRMHIESGEAFFTRPRPEKIKTRTIFVGLKAEFLPAIVACGVLDHECALSAVQMALARRLWLFCASKMRTHGLRTHRLPSAAKKLQKADAPSGTRAVWTAPRTRGSDSSAGPAGPRRGGPA